MEDSLEHIRKRLTEGSAPAVVAVSAPHCPHCRAIAPLLATAASRHRDSVRLLEVSAPAAADLMAEWKVRGTPTLLAFRGGEEVTRHVGAGSPQDVERVFQAAAGLSTRRRSIGRTDRMIRTLTGGALAVVGVLASAWWLAALGGAFVVGGWYDLVPHRDRTRAVRAGSAAARIEREEVVVIDIRTMSELSAGVIPGALHLDLTDRRFDQKVATLDPSQEYLIYCRSGARSARALREFRKAGIDQSTHLTGGIRAWRKAGLPIGKYPDP